MNNDKVYNHRKGKWVTPRNRRNVRRGSSYVGYPSPNMGGYGRPRGNPAVGYALLGMFALLVLAGFIKFWLA